MTKRGRVGGTTRRPAPQDAARFHRVGRRSRGRPPIGVAPKLSRRAHMRPLAARAHGHDWRVRRPRRKHRPTSRRRRRRHPTKSRPSTTRAVRRWLPVRRRSCEMKGMASAWSHADRGPGSFFDCDTPDAGAPRTAGTVVGRCGDQRRNRAGGTRAVPLHATQMQRIDMFGPHHLGINRHTPQAPSS